MGGGCESPQQVLHGALVEAQGGAKPPEIFNFYSLRGPRFAYSSFFSNALSNELEHYNGFENAVEVNCVIV